MKDLDGQWKAYKDRHYELWLYDYGDRPPVERHAASQYEAFKDAYQAATERAAGIAESAIWNKTHGIYWGTHNNACKQIAQKIREKE